MLRRDWGEEAGDMRMFRKDGEKEYGERVRREEWVN